MKRRVTLPCERITLVIPNLYSKSAGGPDDYRVPFVTGPNLFTMLVEAQQQGRLARKLTQLGPFDVLHVGYVRLDTTGADLLFGFISQHYECRRLVVTTNLRFARGSDFSSTRPRPPRLSTASCTTLPYRHRLESNCRCCRVRPSAPSRSPNRRVRTRSALAPRPTAVGRVCGTLGSV